MNIIGGIFGLEVTRDFHNSRPSFLSVPNICLVNARSGIFLLTQLLKPATVWMPSYLCAAMIEAVSKTKAEVGFYEVNCDLLIQSPAWLDDVRQGDLIILVDYFGFPHDRRYTQLAKECGAWVLEDACQALLSDPAGEIADFRLFSPRKFLGVPDGGVLVHNNLIAVDASSLKSSPAEWWSKALEATTLRRKFDLNGGRGRWFELSQEVEAQPPIGLYRMSELTETLLMQSFDYAAIARRRIDNYQFLLDHLSDFALFPALPPGTVPLGFPIRTEMRGHVRQALFNQQIYPPVHWPIRGIVPEEFKDSHHLAVEIMTLPCDQRYNMDDMCRMVQVVLREIG